MKKAGLVALVAVGGILLSSPAWAGFPATTTMGVSDTRAGIGLRFEFGDNAAEVVGSVRHTYTDTNNTVTGGLAEIAIPVITQRNHGPKIRAMGLVGSTCVQGMAGVGYDFANQQALVGAGIQGPYVEGGVNFLFNSELHPYVGVNSYSCAPTSFAVPPPG
jgi:hypothetical protein